MACHRYAGLSQIGIERYSLLVQIVTQRGDCFAHCTILQALIGGWGYRVSVAHNGLLALEQVRTQPFDLILSDVRMAEMDGIAALKAGAYDYLTKPLDFDTLQLTLARALEHTSLKSENHSLKQRLQFDPQNMIGRSEPMLSAERGDGG